MRICDIITGSLMTWIMSDLKGTAQCTKASLRSPKSCCVRVEGSMTIPGGHGLEIHACEAE